MLSLTFSTSSDHVASLPSLSQSTPSAVTNCSTWSNGEMITLFPIMGWFFSARNIWDFWFGLWHYFAKPDGLTFHHNWLLIFSLGAYFESLMFFPTLCIYFVFWAFSFFFFFNLENSLFFNLSIIVISQLHSTYGHRSDH